MSLPLTQEQTVMPSPAPASGAEAGAVPAARQVAQLNALLDAVRSDREDVESENCRLAERLQALLNALPAAVLVLDGRGVVAECNPAAEALLQRRLRGRLWRELIDELFVPAHAGGDVLALHNGRMVTLSTRPLGAEPGQVLLLQDVTERHQLGVRLEQMRRLADMGRMAASLAHQIRTPLSSALLYVSQLRSPRLDEAKRERFVERAMQSLKGLEQLITDMLLFVNNGKAGREALDAAALLAALADELKGQGLERGAVICCAYEMTPCPVTVNRVLLKSALQNLINNALEAGAGRIELAARCAEGRCRLSVSDDGPGIDAAQRQRIFDPFVSNRAGGTGLGLAVVRAVAHAMGGEVSLHSEPGHGATFTISLPVTQRQGALQPDEQQV